MEENNSSKVDVRKVKKLLYILGGLLIVAICVSGYFFYQYRVATTDPNQKAMEELQKTMKLVEKHMVLPTDEQPTLATVADPEKLKDQIFFNGSEKGDKVLIYAKAKKAILYSVNKDRILQVAPFNANANPTGDNVTN